MNNNPLSIERLAFFSCKKADKVFRAKRNLTIEELNTINKNLADVFTDIILGEKKGNGIIDYAITERTGRTHTFSDPEIQIICDNIRYSKSKREFGIYARKIARMYYKILRSQAFALFIFKISYYDNPFLIIYSSEYQELGVQWWLTFMGGLTNRLLLVMTTYKDCLINNNV